MQESRTITPEPGQAVTSLSPIRTACILLRGGRIGILFQELWRRIYSDRITYGLVRDLSRECERAQSRVTFTVRPLRPGDVPKLLAISREQNSSDVYDRLRRQRLLDYGIETCYVAVTEHGDPCFMQWLIGHQQNTKVNAFFGGEYPSLQPDEMLMENAFIPEKYRGQGVMAAAMRMIAEHAKVRKARRIITFVGDNNIASLKGCQRAGFVPYLLRREKWRFFISRFHFENLPAGSAYPYETSKG